MGGHQGHHPDVDVEHSWHSKSRLMSPPRGKHGSGFHHHGLILPGFKLLINGIV